MVEEPDSIFGIPIVTTPLPDGVDWAIAGDYNVVFLMWDGRIIEIDYPHAVIFRKRHEGEGSNAAPR